MLKVLLYEFVIYCKNLALANNSIKELNRYIRQFDEYLQENDLSELSKLQYKQLVAFVISNEAKPVTIKARIWAMKKFFSFLYLNEYIKVNIAKELSPPKIPKKETRFLTGAELEIVFKHLGKGLKKSAGLKDFLIIAFMALSGLRKSSVVFLDLEDFQPQTHRLFITEKGSAGKRPISIPFVLSTLLQEYISSFDIREGALFLNNRNQRLKPDGVNKIVHKLKTELLENGHSYAEKLHPHIFRHSAATQLYDVVGFTVTKEMLGHRNVQNTRKYIHLSPTAYGHYMKQHPYFTNDKAMS